MAMSLAIPAPFAILNAQGSTSLISLQLLQFFLSYWMISPLFMLL